jgi:hypothetical protein
MLYVRDYGATDRYIADAAENHRVTHAHSVYVRPGIGWVCEHCDPQSIVTAFSEATPSVERRPHYRWPQSWPGKVNLYFEQGSVELENSHDGSILFVRAGSRETVCLTYTDALILHRELTEAINEQASLIAKYGEE